MNGFRQKYVPVDVLCPVYQRDPEIVIQAMWGCKGLKSLRSSCDFMIGVPSVEGMHFQDFLLVYSKNLDMETLALPGTIFWRVWFLWNQFFLGEMG